VNRIENSTPDNYTAALEIKYNESANTLSQAQSSTKRTITKIGAGSALVGGAAGVTMAVAFIFKMAALGFIVSNPIGWAVGAGALFTVGIIALAYAHYNFNKTREELGGSSYLPPVHPTQTSDRASIMQPVENVVSISGIESEIAALTVQLQRQKTELAAIQEDVVVAKPESVEVESVEVPSRAASSLPVREPILNTPPQIVMLSRATSSSPVPSVAHTTDSEPDSEVISNPPSRMTSTSPFDNDLNIAQTVFLPYEDLASSFASDSGIAFLHNKFESPDSPPLSPIASSYEVEHGVPEEWLPQNQ
jgi:hypothetical protein